MVYGRLNTRHAAQFGHAAEVWWRMHLDHLPSEKEMVQLDVLGEKSTEAGFCCGRNDIVNGDGHVSVVRPFLSPEGTQAYSCPSLK